MQALSVEQTFVIGSDISTRCPPCLSVGLRLSTLPPVTDVVGQSTIVNHSGCYPEVGSLFYPYCFLSGTSLLSNQHENCLSFAKASSR